MKTGITIVAASMLLAAPVSAASTVSLTNLTAEWLNPTWVGSPAFTNTGEAGTAPGADPTTTLAWGKPTGSENKQSSYQFTPQEVSNALVGATFDFGTFVHNNFPIALPDSLDEVQLKVGYDVTITPDGGSAVMVGSLSSVFNFTHLETSNGANPCAAGGSNPCPDLVSVETDTGASSTFNVDGEEYILSIFGFKKDGTTTYVSEFMTEEGTSNVALVSGMVKAPDSVVPLPAALPLLATGLGLMGALRFRKARKSA